jgi:hypothetical protein
MKIGNETKQTVSSRGAKSNNKSNTKYQIKDFIRRHALSLPFFCTARENNLTQNILSQDFVWVQDTVGIHHVLELMHNVNDLG